VANWRPVLGYQGAYEISDEGEVARLAHTRRTVARNGRESTKFVAWKLLRPIDRHGYRVATLYKDGLPQHWYIHRLVLLTFVGEPEDKQVCCHNDGSRSNNRVDNLRWDSQAENAADSLKHGVLRRGFDGRMQSTH